MASGSDLVPFSDSQGRVDLLDPDRIDRFLERTPVQRVIHLAGQTSVARSFTDPENTLKLNFLGTFNLFRALERQGFEGRVLYISSGDVYGPVAPEELPVSESRWPRPVSPYAVSKVSAEALCYQWSITAPFEVVVARPFNHIGPRQREQFVIASWAKQLVEIERGRREPVLLVGNIDVTRDFTDVRDVVAAYRLLVEKGENGAVYNVASGTERSLRDVIDQLTRLAGLTVEIRQESSRLRESDTPRMRGDAGLLTRHTDWKASIPFEKTLGDILDFWRRELPP